MRIERLRLTYELCQRYALFQLPDVEVIETRPASDAEILRFHTADYVEILKQASQGGATGDLAYGIGPGDNPAFPGLWEWSVLHTGASLQCAQLVSEGTARIAFNIAGGLHHAARSRASGFCYVNDPVLAIYYLVDQGKRVIYLDIDAHHGDGVQWAFYEDPRVLTVSFHQDGRTLFPGSGGLSEIGLGEGTGYAVNIPMLPGTDDEVFWKGFSSLVPRLMDIFKPDVVVTQLGVDTFRDDPLAALEFTTHGFCKVISYLTREALPWVALGGGGYNPANVAQAWTLAWGIMNGVELPDELPQAITSLLNTKGQGRRDDGLKSARRQQCLEHLERCLVYLEKHIMPNSGD